MIIALNILIVALLLGVFIQDLKERQVALLLFIGLFLLGGCLFGFQSASIFSVLFSMGVNSLVVLLILGILLMYTKFKLQKKLSDVFGIGDVLFFLFMAISFPSATFLILFSFSLFFSFALSLVLKKRLQGWVPLAGFQALFIALVILTNQLFQFTNLYAF